VWVQNLTSRSRMLGCCHGQTVAAHHVGHFRRVGTAREADDLGDITKILCTDVGGQDDQHPRCAIVRVAEAMRHATRRIAPFAGL
jgi:hypothetical protein